MWIRKVNRVNLDLMLTLTCYTSSIWLVYFSPHSASQESDPTPKCEMFLLVHVKQEQIFLSPFCTSHTAVQNRSKTARIMEKII